MRGKERDVHTVSQAAGSQETQSRDRKQGNKPEANGK